MDAKLLKYCDYARSAGVKDTPQFKAFLQGQIDVILMIDTDMCDLMINHGRDISVDKDTSTLLWQETAWHKLLKEKIEFLRKLKEESEKLWN